jgi:zinc protease
VINLSVIKDDWEKGLEILNQILMEPRFDEAVLEVVKGQVLTALEREGEDARAVAGREGTIWQFQDHPYGRDPLKGRITIPEITRSDLLAFVHRYFVPSNMVVAVAGDIEKEGALADIKEFLEACPKAAAPQRRVEEPGETPPVLAFIHKPGQVQSQVVLGLRSVTRSHPAYWKMSLLMDIFGGGDSMMYTRLRDDLGLAYAAWFYQTYRWKAGILTGYIGCKSDMTSRAILETVKIMDRLGEEIPEKRLEQKRLDSLNSFVFNVDSPAELVGVYGRYRLRGEPLDTLERIQDAFMLASRQELRSLAGEFLDPKKLQIFVVADKTITLNDKAGGVISLEEDLRTLAKDLGLPYRELELR